MAQKHTSYHHGHLPETLMNLAVQQIEAQGTEKLSMRALARSAGVSPTAPYSHFPTKTCLLAAIATRGFARLKSDMQAVSDTDKDIYDRVVDMGLAYIGFAIRHPTEYRLMFGSVLDDFSGYDMLIRAADDSYQYVRSLLEAMRVEKRLNVELELLSSTTWSMVHGIASLLIDKRTSDEVMFSARNSIAVLRNDTESALRLMMGSLVDSLRPSEERDGSTVLTRSDT